MTVVEELDDSFMYFRIRALIEAVMVNTHQEGTMSSILRGLHQPD